MYFLWRRNLKIEINSISTFPHHHLTISLKQTDCLDFKRSHFAPTHSWTSVSDIILVTTWNAFSDDYQSELEGLRRRSDSIREEHSVSQCDGSSPGIRSDAPAYEAEGSAVSRHGDGIQPALLAAASSDVAAISAHLSGGPQCLHWDNTTLSAAAPKSSAGLFEDTVHLMRRPCDRCPKRLEDKCDTFFPPTSEKHDNGIHGNSSSLMIKAGVALAPPRWTLHFQTQLSWLFLILTNNWIM